MIIITIISLSLDYDNILKNDIIKIELVFKGKKVESSYSYEKNDFNVKN